MIGMVETKQAQILDNLAHLLDTSNSIGEEIDSVTEILSKHECADASDKQDIPINTAGEADEDGDPTSTRGAFTVLSPDDLHTDEYERFIDRQMTYAAIYTDDLVIHDPP